MPRNSRQESLLTRERILDAALDVFHERGVARPSLTDVAARIGMTRGAVYGHFRNKGEVLVALFERERLPWESLDAPVESACDALEALRRTVAAMLRHAACGGARRTRMLGVLFHRVELAVENEALHARMQAARDEALARLSTLVERAAAAKALPGPCPGRAARLLLQGAHGVIADWLWDPSAFDLAREADDIADRLMAAVGARPAPARQRASAPAAPQTG